MSFVTNQNPTNVAGDKVYTSQSQIIYDSSEKIIEQKNLKEFTYDQLKLALNEIYARHGRRFYDTNIQAYFTMKSWYKPLPEEIKYTDEVLNDYERRNIVTIKETMDQYELENKGFGLDFDSLTIDDMRQCVANIYYLQKQYLYSFTITEYYNGTNEFEECFLSQKERLKQVFQFSLLDMKIDEADATTIRALFMNLVEAGYLEHLEGTAS